jgi:hypothetical protein
MQPDVPPIEAVAKLVDGYGVRARALRRVLAALTERSWTLAELVPAVGVPRRTVEEVLRALGPDVSEGRYRIVPALAGAYRARFGYDQLRRTALADPLGPALAGVPDLVDLVRGWRAGAPAPRRALDHVAATPETAVRRALWLDARFDLDGARLLCVGDHDLTALAACLLRPSLAATVVDIDEELLAYIDGLAAAHGLQIRCVAGDLRFALPPSAAGSADLAFTDPPYSPDGVQLFLGRAVQGLRDGPTGRVLLAYGYSDRTPALGVDVQRTVSDLHLAIEAIWPAFHHYDGAQAIGGVSDLYTLQPTARSMRTVASPRFWAGDGTIYTHGAQSAEGAASGLDEAGLAALLAAASGPDDLPVCLVAPDPAALKPAATNPVATGSYPGALKPVAVKAFASTRTLGSVWTNGLPAPLRTGGVAVDATIGPPGWLLRILLAVDAARLVIAVPEQTVLTDLMAAKWTLTQVDGLVVAVAAEPVGLADRIWRHLLDRAHGKVANVWREALCTHAGLDRPAAAAAVTTASDGPLGEQLTAGATLVELPLHQLIDLAGRVRRSSR